MVLRDYFVLLDHTLATNEMPVKYKQWHAAYVYLQIFDKYIFKSTIKIVTAFFIIFF